MTGPSFPDLSRRIRINAIAATTAPFVKPRRCSWWPVLIVCTCGVVLAYEVFRWAL